MALQALASFASKIRGPQSSFDLLVKAKVGLQSHTFDPVTANNMLTLQIWEVKYTVKSLILFYVIDFVTFC